MLPSLTAPAIIPHPHRFSDARGAFTRTFTEAEGFRVAEENESYSPAEGTLRGLHWQEPPQAKLVRVLKGRIFDVIVNLDSGAVMTFTLTPIAGSLFVPKGWAHGFCTLSPHTTVLYKVDEPYAPEAQFCLGAFDPDLAIGWPIAEGDAVMSDKDREAPPLRAIQAARFMAGQHLPLKRA